MGGAYLKIGNVPICPRTSHSLATFKLESDKSCVVVADVTSPVTQQTQTVPMKQISGGFWCYKYEGYFSDIEY